MDIISSLSIIIIFAILLYVVANATGKNSSSKTYSTTFQSDESNNETEQKRSNNIKDYIEQNKAIEDSELAEISKAIELDPNNVENYEKRADIYFDQGKYDKAIADYNKAITYVSYTSKERIRYQYKKYRIYDIYLKNAQQLEAKNDYENAITEYNKAIQMKPLEAKLYEYRSNCYVHIDKEKAKKDFEKAVSLNPSRYSIYTKVRFYQSINDNEKILNIYKNHLEENPQDYYILCERASVWIEMGRIEEAKIDLRKAKKYVNDTEKEAQIQRTLDSLKSTKSKQKTTSSKSTTTSKKQVTVTVQNPDAKENNIKAEKYIENANSYENRKDYISAINEYTKAIELNPDNIAEIYVYRAQCCMEFGQYNNVVKDCTKAIEKTKMYNSTAYYTRGLAYQKLNEKEKAKEDFKQALSIKPDDVTYKKAYDSLLKESSSKINIENCTRADILSLDGFNAEKAERFINYRDNGKMWYDIDTFVQDFGLQPHEMVMIQDRLKFPDKPKNKYGRKIDI